jgi:cell division protein FtsB
MSSPRSVALSLGLSALILYLAAHAVTGRQGLISYMHLQEREHALTAERAALASQRAALEARIERLGSDHLDLDALEEQARRQFDAAHPDEVIFDLAQGDTTRTR